MTSSIDRMRAAWRFFLNGWRDWDQTASFVPSSRFLVDALVQAADLGRARKVMGARHRHRHRDREVTRGDAARRHSLRRRDRRPAARGDRSPAPRSTPDRDPRQRRRSVRPSRGCRLRRSDRRDRVVPRHEPPAARPARRDHRELRARAQQDRRVRAIRLLHAHAIVYSPSRGFSRFHLGRHLGRYFGEQRRQIVVPNIPPAEVLVAAARCRRTCPRAA